jgi:hypothetical protein
MSLPVWPSAFIRRAMAIWAASSTLRGRPNFLPFARAAARASGYRSTIRSHRIPVPRSTEVSAFFDDLKARNAGASQLRPGQQSRDSAAHDRDVDRLRRRRPADRILDVGVAREISERALDGDVLRVAPSD